MAQLWEGLRFHFDVVSRPGRQRKTSVDEQGRRVDEWLDVVQERMMPLRFLGTSQPAPTVTASTSASATASASATVRPTAVVTVPGPASHPALADLGPEDKLKIVALAQSQDFGGFVDGVMGLTTVGGESMLSVASVIQALSDETFYTSLRG
jgi:hypothetical protein